MSKNLSWPMWNLLEKTWQYQPWSFLKFPVFFPFFSTAAPSTHAPRQAFRLPFRLPSKKNPTHRARHLEPTLGSQNLGFHNTKSAKKKTQVINVLYAIVISCYLYLISISLNILDQSECWTLLFPSSHSNVDSRLPTACEVSFQLLESSS